MKVADINYIELETIVQLSKEKIDEAIADIKEHEGIIQSYSNIYDIEFKKHIKIKVLIPEHNARKYSDKIN